MKNGLINESCDEAHAAQAAHLIPKSHKVKILISEAQKSLLYYLINGFSLIVNPANVN